MENAWRMVGDLLLGQSNKRHSWHVLGLGIVGSFSFR